MSVTLRICSYSTDMNEFRPGFACSLGNILTTLQLDLLGLIRRAMQYANEGDGNAVSGFVMPTVSG